MERTFITFNDADEIVEGGMLTVSEGREALFISCRKEGSERDAVGYVIPLRRLTLVRMEIKLNEQGATAPSPDNIPPTTPIPIKDTWFKDFESKDKGVESSAE